jgi:hypothetical protein
MRKKTINIVSSDHVDARCTLLNILQAKQTSLTINYSSTLSNYSATVISTEALFFSCVELPSAYKIILYPFPALFTSFSFIWY